MGPRILTPVHTCSYCPRKVQPLPELFSSQLSQIWASNLSAACTMGLSKGEYLQRVEHTKGKYGKSREMHVHSSS